MLFRAPIIKILILAVSLSGIYFSMQVKLGEDALDMLPGTSLQGDFSLLQQLGMVNRIFISLKSPPGQGSSGSPTPELLTSTQRLGDNLAANPLFDEVFYRLPQGYEFKLANELAGYLPVLADQQDRSRFEDLMKPERLREKLRENFLNLNTPAGFALSRHIQRDPLGFTSIILEKLTGLRGSLKLNIQDGFFVSSDGNHCLLWAESSVPLTSSENANSVNEVIEQALSESLSKHIKASIIGPLPHTLANARTIRSDLTRLLPVAGLVLLTFILLFMRDWRALLLVAMPFLAAPPAIAMVSFLYGKVSAMALGFGIVLLGIGIDFAVHIYLDVGLGQTGGKISADMRRSLFMAFLTTLTVFGVLLLSRVPAHRQMASLGIIGLSWAFFLAWHLVPYLAGRTASVSMNLPVVGRILSTGQEGQRPVFKIAVWLLLMLSGLVVWPSLSYNGDLRALDVPSPSIKKDERAFLQTWGGAEEQAFVVAEGGNWDIAMDINTQVYDILRQEGKTAGTQTLAVLLPGLARQEENLAGWREFKERILPDFEIELQKAAVDSGFTQDAFAPFINWLKLKPEKLEPAHLLDGPLRPFVYSLYRENKPVTGGSGEKNYLAVTLVPDKEINKDVLEKLVREIEGVNVISSSRWRQRVEDDLRKDIVRLSTIAAFLVVVICGVFFRRVRPVVAVLAPVGSALAAMAVFAALTGGELNIMHALMGIMVIGLSVDYGIFIVGSCRAAVGNRTVLAVTVCAISTLSGFGVLGFADHPALYALGVTVLAGIGAAWPTALYVSPALLFGSERQVVDE